MLKIERTIIVEGNYDKIKLSNLVDAHIIATNGFRIFRDKAMKDMIKALCMKTGIIILILGILLFPQINLTLWLWLYPYHNICSHLIFLRNINS